jgi:hypothetical protein
MLQDRGERLNAVAHMLQPAVQVVGWAILVLFGAWMMAELVVALVRVMNFWISPGLP